MKNRIAAPRGRFAVALAAALLIAPVLTACTSNPLESVVEQVTGGNVDLGGTSVPDDFPADIPVYDGEIVQGFGLGTGADKAWTVIVKVPDAAAIDTIVSELENAGLAKQLAHSADSAAGATFASDTHTIVVGVTPDGAEGFVATYIVTPKAS
jgi:hypothetical protein